MTSYTSPNMKLATYMFKQKNDWTCGPAVARIILKYRGIKAELGHIIKELGTTREGTENRALMRLMKKKGINCVQKQNATLVELKKHSKNKIVVVAYWIPRSKVSHYSIVKRVAKKRIYFHDTWYGSRHSYSIDYFLKNWFDDEAFRWMLVVGI